MLALDQNIINVCEYTVLHAGYPMNGETDAQGLKGLFFCILHPFINFSFIQFVIWFPPPFPYQLKASLHRATKMQTFSSNSVYTVLVCCPIFARLFFKKNLNVEKRETETFIPTRQRDIYQGINLESK